MNGSPQASAQPTEDNAIKQGVDWVAKHWPRVRLGHEGMMLEKIQRQNRIVEVDARNTMTGKVDDTEGWPESGDDSMGVDIGDTTHNHYYPADTPAESPPTQPPPKPAGSLLKKAAIAVALLGSGLAAGAAGALLVGALNKPPAVEAPAPVDRTDKWLGVRTEKWTPPQAEPET